MPVPRACSGVRVACRISLTLVLPLRNAPHCPLPRARSGRRCSCHHHAHTSTREQLFLPPLEKLKKYGVFPTKLVLNVVVALLSFVYVCGAVSLGLCLALAP